MMGLVAKTIQRASHAEFSPSSSERAINCPASVTKTRGMKDQPSSDAALEGTCAHNLAHLMIMGQQPPKFLVVEGKKFEITDEMLDHITRYVDFVDMLRAESDIFGVEQPVDLDWFFAPEPPPVPVYGTSDLVSYNAMTRALTIADLKYGFMYVDPTSPQLMVYSAGAIGLLGGHEMPHTINLVIVQPRSTGHPFRIHTITFKELMDWLQDVLVPALKRIANNDETESPGAWCKYCKRAGECASLRSQALAAAQNDFDDATPLTADDLTNEQLGEILSKADMIEAWVKIVRATASHRLDIGQNVPGWKLVAKRGIRKWIDEEEARAALSHEDFETITKNELYTPQQLRSPAQIEKVLKRCGISADVLEPLVSKESSGTTLVRDGDARPMVTSKAGADLFADPSED